jgi:hypothetical protein
MIARVDSIGDPAHARNVPMLGTWWGYADADRRLVGVVVVILVVAAVGFLLRRYLEHRRTRR